MRQKTAFLLSTLVAISSIRSAHASGFIGGGSGGINGVTVSGTPSAGQVPTATGTTTATWQTPSTAGWSYSSPRISLTTAGNNVAIGTPVSDDAFAKCQITGDATKRNVVLWAGAGGFVNLQAANGQDAIVVANDNVQLGASVNVSTSGGTAAVWSGTLETRFGGPPDYPQAITQAATFTIGVTAYYWYAASASAQTGTLPTAVGCQGRTYKIKQTGAGQLTLATTSSQTIDGSLTYVFPAQKVSITVASDGANWQIH